MSITFKDENKEYVAGTEIVIYSDGEKTSQVLYSSLLFICTSFSVVLYYVHFVTIHFTILSKRKDKYL